MLGKGEDKCTAVTAWTDWLAERTYRSLLDLGIDVPGEVAVTGFDGFSTFYSPQTPLTTIHAPWARVGQEGVRRLAGLIAGEAVPTLTLLSVDFKRGQST